MDKCRAAQTEGDFIVDDRACRTARETPGENKFLNVNTYLQLGGIKSETDFADLEHFEGRRGRPFPYFKGCLKDLIHNKQVRVHGQALYFIS